MIRLALALGSAFIATLAIAPRLIPWLKKLKIGQNIRTFGPQTHLRKQGVPSMGGIMISILMLVCAMAFSFGDGRVSVMLPVVAFTALCALIGFLDDYIKVVKKRSMGLRARDKTWMLLLVAIAFSWYCYQHPQIGSSIYVPFVGWEWDLGIWYIPFSVFVIYATVNCANLTDGVDGLLSSVTMIMASAFALICYFALELGQAVYGNMMVLSGAVAGACLGFLFFNRYPARVMMGDTGSFGLGGALVGVAMATKLTLLIPIVGFVYVVSAVSDILQVLSYKLRDKPMFRLAPLHHHLELGGMKEPKIVALYSVVTLVMCALAVFSVAI